MLDPLQQCEDSPCPQLCRHDAAAKNTIYFYMRCRDTHSTRHAQTHTVRTHIVHVWFRCTCLCICTYSCTAHACNERS